MFFEYLPTRINSGRWISAWSLFQLRRMQDSIRFVLPVCSIRNGFDDVNGDEDTLLLPPLFREALSPDAQNAVVNRILECFPVYGDAAGNRRRVDVVEVEPVPAAAASSRPAVIAFSVDTAVEEHGPHLPLGTDTIQSYSVLRELAASIEGFQLAKPLEYGQLTWGLPFGYSVDLTAELLTEYVAGYVNALLESERPQAVYVVDVHGSITHRQAIVDGLRKSRCDRWAFRWLHEPLAEFASARGDQHAGGVETALVERVSTELIDRDWFPARESEIVDGQMTLDKAVELTPDLAEFSEWVHEHAANGIVGDVRNYHSLDADLMFDRMLNIANADVADLLAGRPQKSQDAGGQLW